MVIYSVDCDIQLLNNWSLMPSHRTDKRGGGGGGVQPILSKSFRGVCISDKKTVSSV